MASKWPTRPVLLFRTANSNARDGLHFDLHCANPQAASGSAVFEVGSAEVSALLELKMGGKNMTLSQRLHGPRVGPCPESPAAPRSD